MIFAGNDNLVRDEAFVIHASLSVFDKKHIWQTACDKIMSVSGMDIDDVRDLIGDEENPNIENCITTIIAAPARLAGCTFSDIVVHTTRTYASDDAYCECAVSVAEKPCRWRRPVGDYQRQA